MLLITKAIPLLDTHRHLNGVNALKLIHAAFTPQSFIVPRI